MDIISRLRRYIERHNIPVTRFADDCGIPRPTLSQLLSGRNKKVSDEVITKIHQAYPSLSVMWLMFGEGDMDTAHAPTTPVPPSRLPLPEPEGAMPDPFAPPANGDGAPQRINFDVAYIAHAPDDPCAAHTHTPEREEEQRDVAPVREPLTRGRRVVSIVVYYDDSSYATFLPAAGPVPPVPPTT